MRQLRDRALVRIAVAAAFVVSISALCLSASSSPAEASTEPNAIQEYCDVGYGLTDANAPDSPVQYYTDGYSGTPYTNNWKCDYLAVYSVPMPDLDASPDEMNLGMAYTMPPIHESVGINFRQLCSLEYPGSTLVWVPGPETGLDGAPWACD
jgi:hypothetical protein